MRATNTPVNMSDDRQREYQRQQERLKAMAGTADKVKAVSADMMIENLLKDSFKKPTLISTHNEKLDQSYGELPLWIQCESSGVPPQYKYLWSLVQSTSEMADTQKVSQLLLTSGLHVDVLGFIWNLANKIIPGQLTKQEFYIVLALVGLAQTGCTFNNLSVLKLIPVPSIPSLQSGVLKNSLPSPGAPLSVEAINSLQQFPIPPVHQSTPLTCANGGEKSEDYLFTNSAVSETNSCSDIFDSKKNVVNKNEEIEDIFFHGSGSSKTSEPHKMEVNRGPYKNSNFPCIGSSPTAEFEDDFSEFQSVPVKGDEVSQKTKNSTIDVGDDFTEFQSANVEHLDPFETVVITQKREIPKIPLPKSFTGKLTSLKTNILKISPESERKLKILSQPESLSSLPESKISSNNKVSTSISLLGSNHGIGSRLANHSFSAKLDRPKHHKHHKIKMSLGSPAPSSGEEEIILGVKTTNIENLIPKCVPKNSAMCKTFVLKETKIGNDDASEPSVIESVETESGSPVGQSTERGGGETTRQIEIPMLGTFNETVLPTQTKLQTSSIDLITVHEDKYSALREIDLNLNQEKVQSPDLGEGNDDFGDFLSADIPPPAPAPPDIVVPPACPPVDVTTVRPDSDLLMTEAEEQENWGDWNFNTEPNLKSSNADILSSLGTDNVQENQVSSLKVGDELFDSLTSLSLKENVETINSALDSRPQVQQSIFEEIESNNVLDTKSDILGGMFGFDGVQNEKTNDISSQSKPDQLNNQSDSEFWEFLSSEVKPPTGGHFSRQGSLPSLDLKMSPTDELEQEQVWRKCLESCHNLIQEGFEIFNNITKKSVLDEVFASPKTGDYLNYLNIVYQISQRISQNSLEFFSSQEDLERLWGRLRDLCFEYNIKLNQDEDTISEGKTQCSICLKYVGNDLVNQGASSYHPSCANLWINFVEGTLPYSS